MTSSARSLHDRALVHGGRHGLHDRYVGLLCVSLAGYAIFGKGFAYLGIAPLYIGEMVLALGLVVLLRSGCWVAVLSSLPSLLVCCLIVLMLARTVPYLSTYGLDAPRDAMIIAYGLFAFVVIALILEQPARFRRVLETYGGFARFYGAAGGAIYHLTNPGILTISAPIHLPMVRAGEAAVHIAGAGVFMLLGLKRESRLWWVLLLASIVMIVPSRAAMLTCLLPLALGAILGGQVRRVLPGVATAIALLAAAWAFDIDIQAPGGRTVGPAQMVENVASILGRSEESNLDGTKTWRLRWWETIRGYTLHGDLFWTGKGFGINLAEADGFTLEAGKASLRSPHNGHMTILARAGVPGLALWVATCGAWFWYVGRAVRQARRLGRSRWADVFVWVICYASAILINASFDVALEGPMMGIWFWSIFGFGIAAVMVFEAETTQAIR